MRHCCAVLILFALLAAAAPGTASERTEVVVDASVSMWQRLGSGGPRIVVLRQALDHVLADPAFESSGLELALRTVGGHHELIDDRGCEETELALPMAPPDRVRWRQAVADLYPLGRRPLALAVEQAAAGLRESGGGGRLVLVTAGGDDCGGDLGALLQELAEGANGLEVRIVGLGLDRDTANAATMLLPTRNVFDAGGLAEALSWALDLDRPRPRPVDFEVGFGGRPIESGTLVINAALGDATTTATIDRGAARARLDPGLYDLKVPTTEGAQMTVSGVAVSHDGEALRIEIPDIAPVTLEIDPELPWNSSTIYVHYWGAPAEASTVVVAEADAELREWLVRAEAEGPTGEVALRLPGSSRELEARMLREIGGGAVVEVGHATITSRQPTAAIDVPESVEIATPMTVTWEGPNLPGDHLMITGAGGESVAACITARSGGPVELVAPAVPGTYTVRYMNAMERALARSDMEVYEILATVDFLPHVRSRNEVEVAWTGPAGELDFLSLARPDAEPEVYSEWAPVAAGSPLRLQTPAAAGDYEIRYVRGSDHEILARGDLHVVTVDLELKVPPRVRAGERFKIRLRGTTEPGDIIAVAAVEADVRDHLDWVDADGEGSYDLAAPFEPGMYEVRYIASSDLEIRTRSTFEAR